MQTVEAILDGTRFKGALVGSTREKEGTKLSVDFQDFPALLIGDQVELVVHQGPHPASTGISARLVFEERTEGHVGCQFLVDDSLCLRRLAGHERQSVRVRPSSDSPVAVHLKNGIEVIVNDLSVGGVSLIIPREDQSKLADQLHLSFDLRLPASTKSMTFQGTVVHRKLAGSAVLYGVQFDELATKSFDAKQALIHSYVMRRQAEMLRNARMDRESA